MTISHNLALLNLVESVIIIMNTTMVRCERILIEVDNDATTLF